MIAKVSKSTKNCLVRLSGRLLQIVVLEVVILEVVDLLHQIPQALQQQASTLFHHFSKQMSQWGNL
jgi:hypothetical protein